MEPSLVLGGWLSTLCKTRDCACVTAGPDKPAAAPWCRWPRPFLRCAIRPPTDSPPRIGDNRTTILPVFAGRRREHSVTITGSRGANGLGDNGARDTGAAVVLRRSGWPRHLPHHRVAVLPAGPRGRDS